MLLIAAGAGFVEREALLRGAGRFLVRTDPLERAEIVVALAGDGSGARVMKAAELVDQGYAPGVLVNGARLFYQIGEARAAIEFAAGRGVRREILEPFVVHANSTLGEALETDRELRRRGVRRALVVTSNFHTRRARSIFRRFGSGEVSYVFVAADAAEFDPDSWWRSRTGKRTLLLEYLKTLHSAFERPPR